MHVGVRVIGIDPGSVSVDVCGLDNGRVFLDRSIPTRDAFADPALLVGLLEEAAPLDLVAGPSGYGLPFRPARALSETDIRMATLSARGEEGGIGGLSALLRALGRISAEVVLTPGVVHLGSVPVHRKINRVDMGTADKVCAAALAVHELARRRGCSEHEVSLILVELGGAFTAALAVDRGRIVDGAGGSSGPLGVRASGAMDGEVAFLAGRVTKQMIFSGGALAVAGLPDGPPEAIANARTDAHRVALDAYVESAVKAVAALKVSSPGARDVLLSGRLARVDDIRRLFAERVSAVLPGMTVDALAGFATIAKHAAQGAALVADGLAGGAAASLVEAMGLRDARGTVLDHLYVISASAARDRLGIEDIVDS